MSEVRGRAAQVGQPECGDDVPDAEEADPRIRLDDPVRAGLADAALLDAVAEVQGGRCAAAEADDVDGVIAGSPLRAQMIVRLVDARAFTQSEETADDLADRVPAC